MNTNMYTYAAEWILALSITVSVWVNKVGVPPPLDRRFKRATVTEMTPLLAVLHRPLVGSSISVNSVLERDIYPLCGYRASP